MTTSKDFSPKRCFGEEKQKLERANEVLSMNVTQEMVYYTLCIARSRQESPSIASSCSRLPADVPHCPSARTCQICISHAFACFLSMLLDERSRFHSAVLETVKAVGQPCTS